METIIGYEAAAAYLDLSVPTLKRRVRERAVPHVKIGHRVLFPVNVLDSWLAEQAQASVRPAPTRTADPPRRRPRRIVQALPASGGNS